MVENKIENNKMLINLNSVRNNYDIFELSEQVKKRGDLNNLSKHLNIERHVLNRAIKEARMLSILPKMMKAKVTPLSTLKVSRERDLFLNEYDINKISCRELYKIIKKWRISLEKDPKILLTNEQHDLIIGSTLGDANIRQRNENCSFRVSHSLKQKEYLYWKYNTFKEFTLSLPYLNKRGFNNLKLETLDLSTFTHRVFNFYRKLFYKKGRKIVTRGLLNMLNPRSLAVWICDDGSFCVKQKYIILCTNSYSLEEHKIIKEYFKDSWNLDPTIGFRDKKYYYLRFNKNDTKKLIEIIEPFVHNSMKYKVGKNNA
ncbi:MAG: LAGLIDADG endonuclease [archaeon]